MAKKWKRKLKTQGLLVALALVSIIGFTTHTIFLLTGFDIFGSFIYSSTLLGIGLIFESNIKKTLAKKNVEQAIPKIITFLVGLVITLGGLSTIPALGITLSPALSGVIAFANVIAILVIAYELFLID